MTIRITFYAEGKFDGVSDALLDLDIPHFGSRHEADTCQLSPSDRDKVEKLLKDAGVPYEVATR